MSLQRDHSSKKERVGKKNFRFHHVFGDSESPCDGLKQGQARWPVNLPQGCQHFPQEEAPFFFLSLDLRLFGMRMGKVTQKYVDPNSEKNPMVESAKNHPKDPIAFPIYVPIQWY